MSNSDKRIGRKLPLFVRREDSPGVRLDSGPYIGKIKNNLDTLRAGRLEVWISDLGGKEDDPHSWRTVHYASPFFGSSSQESDEKGNLKKENNFKSVRHTYGMWFTPPDVDNFVICTFIAGDPMRGFWFACVPNQLGQHMVPAIAASKNIDSSKILDSAAKEIYESGNLYPVVEFNENTNNEATFAKFVDAKKPLHEYQLKVLGNQGLDKDTVRGVITSSSQRESPSAVFGISTPGRPITEQSEPSGDEITTKNLEVYGRQGGHTLVMDDGDYEGKNQLMRFRTAAGHQIMMNDSEEIIYIANSTGKVWLEMTGTGNLHVYSEESVSFRAKKGFNFFTEKDFNVQADGNINFKAKKNFNLESDATKLVSGKVTTIYGGDIAIGSQGKINLDAKNASSFNAGGNLTLYGTKIKLNSGKGPAVNKPSAMQTKNFADAEKNGQKWKSSSGKIKSIVSIIPTHEPWPRAKAQKQSAGSAGSSGTGSSSAAPADTRQVVSGGGAIGTGTPDTTFGSGESTGINQAAGQSIKRAVDPSYLNRADNPTTSSGIGSLSADEVKALKTQIGYSESGFKYDAVEARNGNYIGKYQLGSAALVDQGYIKPDAYAKYGTSALQYPSSWSGKDGITSKSDFLNNGSVQEKAMDNLLQSNYSTLTRTGGIRSTDDSSTVAGMLATSHLLGAGGATRWRVTGGGADANGTTGTTYFNQGRYAVDVLTKRG
jgi:hypothetical protein